MSAQFVVLRRPIFMALALALPGVFCSMREAVAQGQPVYMGSNIPVAIWAFGTIVLGCVIAYGILRTRRRTQSEKDRTEEGTKEVYRQEERKRVRSGLE